ncbi:MAG: FAD-binding protein [Deltaproteobacteria bacterium]|nr:FAD-binding protein [Deltaproteobacteria bacterium]
MLHRSAVEEAVAALRRNPASDEAASALHELALGADGADAEVFGARLGVVGARARPGCVIKNNLTMPRCPGVIARPGSEAEIAAALERDRVKAIGGGWGFSGAAHTAGVAAIMDERFAGLEDIPAAELRPGIDAGYLCRFKAGTTIAQLDVELAARHRALANAPGFERLTFVGTASVGGNGSGSWLGPLSEQIRSIDLMHVDADGDVRRVRVEPETTPRPITDPAAFGGTVVFDDALFAACKVGLGLLGVIVSVTIDVVPDFFLVERRERHAWSSVVENLPRWLEAQGSRDSGKAFHSVEVWLNPYRKKASCVVGTRAWTPLKTRLGERPYALRAGSAATFRLISTVMRAIPRAVPTLLNASLALTAHGDVRMPSWLALSFGTPNLAEVHPAAVALDASDPAALIAKLTTIRAWLRAEYEANRYISSPIGLRFVGGASAPLSPHHGRRSCLVELPMLVGTPHWERVIAGFHQLAATLGGRPHWGQIHDLDAAGLTAAYGAASVAAFKQARDRLDRLGRCDNPLAVRLGLATASAPAGLVAAAAASREATPSAPERRSWSRLFVDPNPRPTVVAPGDLLAQITTLRAEGKRLVLNGGNGSLHTQNLSDGQRHYFDTELNLSRGIGPITTASAPRITVGAGATWGEIVKATRAQGYLPRIVPTFRGITVGGSLSANAIGQASRHAGHELDGVVSIDAVVPGGQSQAPQRVTIDPRNPGSNEDLLRALVGGYGQIGIIAGATYELVAVPRDARAVTTVRRFDHADVAGALRALQNADARDALNKSCVLFHRKGRWNPTVLSTHFAVVPGDGHPSLLTYNDNTTGGTRRLAEGLLSFMPTAHLAGKLADAAMKRASDDGRRYVDPIEGFLFVMDPNHAYKESLSPAGQAVFAPTLQQTFVVPDAAAADFIGFVQERLALPKKALRGELRALGARPEAEVVAAFEGDALGYAAQIERDARELEASAGDDDARRLTALRATSRATPAELGLALVQRMANLSTLVPALFEVVWVPRDDQLLSATFRQSGFAVSLTFQGPGVARDASIVAHSRVFERLHLTIHEALASIAQRCADLGGRFNLSKNVFAPGPGDQSTFVRGVLAQRGDSLERFEAIRDRYNHGGFLGSRFGSEVLGLR